MRLFGLPKIEKQQAVDLYEARRLYLEHASHAEYHNAMAEMLLKRIERLSTDPFTPPATPESTK